ncbi:MAG: replication-associated recombination protein A [Gammaproteobacteria bacterium]|nr:MAG: replication-associated recombination protein A [Gammaproteobacteria bacterium]
MADKLPDIPTTPLAARMRPRCLSDYVGQSHLLAEGRPLYKAVADDRLHSMILWGPPGSGKTSLAMTIAESTKARFVTLSAVTSGVKDIRQVMSEAGKARQQGEKTVLFVDEVHRFNKAQQDAFLPYIEDGTIIFIGATTENPAFELNRALLSRARVYVIKPLSEHDISQLLRKALSEDAWLRALQLELTPEALAALARAADGDARRALNLLEMAAMTVDAPGQTLDIDALGDILHLDVRAFDKGGDLFYDQISALHKSVRGSQPDASLYWLCRMLDGGADGHYIARRLVRMASEDIGNADPRALTVAVNAWQSYERLGSPEGDLALAQAVVYLASAPKSNAVYTAFKQAMQDVRQLPSYAVPVHLRNAPTKLAKTLGHGKEYQYPHDDPSGYIPGIQYFPDEMTPRTYYQPVNRGLEQKIAEKLAWIARRESEHKAGKS